MEEEIWKISNDGYQVSNFGLVINKLGKQIKGARNKVGNKSVSRLVFETFLGEIPPNYLVFHRDKDSSNNRSDNLFLVSPSDKSKLYASARKQAVTEEKFIERAKTAHGDKYDYSELNFKSINAKVSIICPDHGLFKQVGSDHASGHGCWTCHTEKSKKWTDEEDEILRQNYEKGREACKKLLNRKTGSAIVSRAYNLGIAKKSGRIFDSKIPAFIWNGLEKRAMEQKRGNMQKVDFEREYLWELYLKQDGKCAMTGWDIQFTSINKENTASVDRIDSNENYIKSNIQLVHKDVNRMKNAFSDEYFYKVCKAVTANRQSKFVIAETIWEWDHWHDTDIPRTVWHDSTESFTK
jgi:GH24 family phage-related lysozyme (muramidase)